MVEEAQSPCLMIICFNLLLVSAPRCKSYFQSSLPIITAAGHLRGEQSRHFEQKLNLKKNNVDRSPFSGDCFSWIIFLGKK